MKRILVVALAAVAMVSCTQNEELVNDGPVEIRLNARIAAAVGSKAAVNPGQELPGLQFAKADGDTPEWANGTLLTGNVADDGTITFTPTVPYYPSDGSATNLVAYYPAATSLASGVALMKITGAEDVMYAPAISGSKSAPITDKVMLAHQLTQFSFIAKRDASTTTADVASVSITVSDANTTFDMALADGTLSNWAVPSTINAMTNGTATIAGSALTAGIMLEPGLSSIDLKVSATGYPTQTITISGTDGGKFIQGNSYEITLTFKGTSIDPSAEIAAWSPGTDGNGDVQ